LLCCLLKVARAAVVPETGPKAQNFFRRRGGESLNIRKTLKKSLVVRNRRRYASLLQHDFRKPNSVRVFCAAPRQVALKLAKPGKQLFAKCCEFAGLQHCARLFSHTGAAPAGPGVREPAPACAWGNSRPPTRPMSRRKAAASRSTPKGAISNFRVADRRGRRRRRSSTRKRGRSRAAGWLR
jgi:hypothetical protein